MKKTKLSPSDSPEYRRLYRQQHRAEFAAEFAACRKPLVGEARERHREYMRQYYLDNPHRFSTEATRVIRRRHYQKHRERLLQETKAKRQPLRDEIETLKCRPCSDCGKSYPPYVMDFDHVRGKKLFQVAGHLHFSRTKVLAEVAKCDVVCSNCHRMRTFRHKETQT